MARHESKGRGVRRESRSKEAARSGLMARIKHPADVFSDACSVESRLTFRRGGRRGAGGGTCEGG